MAARAIVLSEIMRGKSFDLTADRITIGRTEVSDICIPDGTLSTNHAELIREGELYKVIDQGSTNGTRVNGKNISESVLKGADILQVGGIEILFDCETENAKTYNATKTNINLDKDIDFEPTRLTNIDPISSGNKEVVPKGHLGMNILVGTLTVVAGVLVYLVVDKFLLGK